MRKRITNQALKMNTKKYSLTYLMEQSPDFKNEKSVLEKLAEDLSTVGGFSVKILVSVKYHCELARECIEYAWGYSKKERLSVHSIQ